MPYRRVVEFVGNTGAWALFSIPHLNADLKLNSEYNDTALRTALGESGVG
jgi:hypothetical protein